MSLEQSVSELVGACNRLTNTVEGKDAQIDAALQNGLNSIPAAIRKEAKKTIYLDQVNGSDLNDGTSVNKSVKTMAKIGDLVTSGGVAEICLLNDYIYTPMETLPAFYGSCVQFRSYDFNNIVKIKFSVANSPDTPDQFIMRSLLFYQSGSLEFYKINLELPDVPLSHGVGKVYPHGASVVRCNSGSVAVMTLNVRLSEVNLIVPDAAINEFHFVGNPSGITNLSLSNVTYPASWRDRNKFFYQGQLSDTLIGKRLVTSADVMSTDESVYNSGIVK
ncbi:TPA: hypothetical protein NGR29_004481 [Vibrio parahaemolyticus]|nr:hypothetical protein [Vibrio parahaemolyticus]